MDNNIIKIPDYAVESLKKYGNVFLLASEQKLSLIQSQYVINHLKALGLNVDIQETYYSHKKSLDYFSSMKNYYSYVVYLR